MYTMVMVIHTGKEKPKKHYVGFLFYETVKVNHWLFHFFVLKDIKVYEQV